MIKKYALISLFALAALTIFAEIIFSASFSDPFEGTALQNANWKWQNKPDKWDVGKTRVGWLTFTPKVNQNLWSDDSTTRLYQETSADKFSVETHVMVTYKGECMVAGLVVKSATDNNWTTLKFWGRAADAIIQWQHKENEVVGNVPDSTQPAGTIEAFLRMEKNGDNYLGWWKRPQDSSWTAVKPDAPMKLTPPLEVGIFGGICAATGEATVQYEYFRDLGDPVTSVEPAAKLSATWGQLKSLY